MLRISVIFMSRLTVERLTYCVFDSDKMAVSLWHLSQYRRYIKFHRFTSHLMLRISVIFMS